MKTSLLKSLILAACLGQATGMAHAQLKIGFSGPLTGSAAALGQDQLDGLMLGVEQLGGKFGGQPVTVLREDDQLKPEVGNQIVRKFIEKEKVNAIVGLGFSNVMMATVKPIVDSGVVAITTNAATSVVAGPGCAPNLFSVAWQNDGPAEAAGKYVADAGFKRVYVMAPNYQAGKDMVAGFKRFYKTPVADEVLTQIGQTDYSAEITQLQTARPDAVFVFYPGAMGVNFVKQFSQAGLMGKIPLFSVFTIDATSLPSLQDAANGAITGASWDASLDNAQSRKFVEAFKARYKRVPSQFAAAGFDAALLLDVAVRKAGAQATNNRALAAAVKAAGSEFQSVRGAFKFNKNNMPIHDYYMFKVDGTGSQQRVRQLGVALQNHADAYHATCAMK